MSEYDLLIKESIKFGRIIIANQNDRKVFIFPNYTKCLIDFTKHPCILKTPEDNPEKS